MLMDWQWWCAAALILMILEVLTPGFLLACFGISALASALGAWMGLELKGQFLLFSATTLGLSFTLRPFALRYLSKTHLKSNADALIGQKTVALSEINSDRGYVNLDGLRWLARSADGTTIPAGSPVEVLAVGGAIVMVRRDGPAEEHEKH